MTNTIQAPEPMSPDDFVAQKRRNIVWLVVLLLIVAALFAVSRPLFNNFHDPYMSETTISH